MAEYSYFWDGTTLGDASLAAYSSQFFGNVTFGRVYANDDAHIIYTRQDGADGFLQVEPGLTLDSVILQTGWAVWRGHIYKNDSPITFSTPYVAPGGYYYVVLAYDGAGQTIRAAITTVPTADMYVIAQIYRGATSRLIYPKIMFQPGQYVIGGFVQNSGVSSNILFNVPSGFRQLRLSGGLNGKPNSSAIDAGFGARINGATGANTYRTFSTRFRQSSNNVVRNYDLGNNFFRFGRVSNATGAADVSTRIDALFVSPTAIVGLGSGVNSFAVSGTTWRFSDTNSSMEHVLWSVDWSSLSMFSEKVWIYRILVLPLGTGNQIVNADLQLIGIA